MADTTSDPNIVTGAWPRGVGWRIAVTHLSLIFEALWPRMWPASGIAGLYITVSLWDLWLYVPGIAHMAALLGMSFWCAFALWQSFKDLKWPTRAMAIRRLEQDNRFEHRPLSTFGDRPAFDGDDPETLSLWQRHRAELGQLITSARLHLPHSTLPERDPHALRALLVLLLIPSFFVAGADWRERLTIAFTPNFSWSTATVTPVEAWIDPPDYTGVAPIFLAAGNGRDPATGPIEVPADSLLTTRTPEKGNNLKLRSSASKLEWIHEDDARQSARLETSQRVQIKQNGRAVATWDFQVIPDRAPAITLTEPLRETVRKTLEVPFAARDDYGVEDASIQFSLISDTQPAASDDILSVPLTLPARNAKRIDETDYMDLTSHPWAGLPVKVELVAIDAIGQIGRSEPIEGLLPERIFVHPLARALIEQRRNLARSTNSWNDVALALDAIALTSVEVQNDYTVFLGLRSAYWSLVSRQPQHMSEIEDVYALLWDLALRIEDGDTAEAEQKMRMAQQALMDALAQGADQKTTQDLMRAYNKALNDYLKSLAEQAMAQDRQSQQPTSMPANSKQLRAEDLQKLMQDIQDMIATGDTEGARKLLAELQRMMENLATGAPPPMSPEQAQLTEAIGNLSEILDKQRSLLDETFSRGSSSNQPGSVDQENLPAPGQAPTPSSSGAPSPLQGLAPSQSGLGADLGDLTGEISGLAPGADGLEGLQAALEAMQDAAQSLEDNDSAAAVDDQRRAIDELSQGANDLAQQLLQQMAASSRQQPGDSQDPLGRTPGSANSLGDNVKVPNQRDLQRARDILQELQKRAGENDRPSLELQYLERLLKRF